MGALSHRYFWTAAELMGDKKFQSYITVINRGDDNMHTFEI